ncbi:hypothetical protein Bca52824_084283 [Brassica carinata]|uniref:Uncharacterized protein n=1 Tax=Brassica carinata TaxID=52824 RepID=A0A8X7TTW1_BRACI|nr:hypothetical protein Bca52824_084283 [Brassica carinata]
MSDLGEKILTRVGSTWEGITKSWVVLGKKAADEFLVGFVKMNNKVYLPSRRCIGKAGRSA